MSTKPSIVPTWATSGTRTQPISAKRNAGFGPKERLPGQFANWLWGLLGDWAQYLNDGAFTGGVSVAGGLTADTLHVTGDTTLDGNIVRNVRHRIPMGSAYCAPSGVLTLSASVGWQLDATHTLYYPIPVNNGQTITAYRVHMQLSNGATTVTTRLAKFNANGLAETLLGSGVSMSGSSGYTQAFAESGLSIVTGGDASTADSFQYYIKVTATGTGDTALHAEYETSN